MVGLSLDRYFSSKCLKFSMEVIFERTVDFIESTAAFCPQNIYSSATVFFMSSGAGSCRIPRASQRDVE